MNKRDFFYQFKEWREDGEPERIIDAILRLPDSKMDDDYLAWLAEAYIDAEEYKKAIAVLESQRERMDGDYKWHFRMALALFHASEDEECEDDENLRRNILVRAKVALARGMNMNPPQSVLQTADYYMEQISDVLDELDGVEAEDNAEDIEDYDDEELDVLEEHIKKYFGDFPTVCQEVNSEDINCDICIIPPTKERDYFTLVTMGMGAHRMNTPKQFSENASDRAELLICLPPDWKVGENSEEWFWPFSLLKGLARLPINCDTWLGWGHTVDNRTPFAANTSLCGSLLIYPEDVEDGADVCILPNGDAVNFYEVVPLYRDEMEYKMGNDAKALLRRMENVSHVVDVNRPTSCFDFDSFFNDFMTIDCAADHSDKIDEKNLPIGKINSCNHIAIFLRWCIEHDLMSREFCENCPEIVEGVKSGKTTDLRMDFLLYFEGELYYNNFNRFGAKFAGYYYNRSISGHYFPADVDSYAEKYFGKERYESEEFQDEAYLFVPFDEDYYNGLSEYIDNAFNEFSAEFKKRCAEESGSLAREANEHFGLSAKLITTADEFSADKYAKQASQCKCPQYILMEPYPITLQEELADLFGETLSADAALVTVALADIEDMEKWARCRFPSAAVETMSCSEDLKKLRQKSESRLGTGFSILTFDHMNMELLLPKENGDYLRFSDKAYYPGDHDCDNNPLN